MENENSLFVSFKKQNDVIFPIKTVNLINSLQWGCHPTLWIFLNIHHIYIVHVCVHAMFLLCSCCVFLSYSQLGDQTEPVEPSNHMSNLDVAPEQQGHLNKATSKEKCLSKPRLVADPTVGTRELFQVLKSFLSHKGTTDLHSLVTPGKYIKISWKPPLDGEWLEKWHQWHLILRRWHQIQSSQEKKMREAINKLIMDSGEVKNTTRTGKPLWTPST